MGILISPRQLLAQLLDFACLFVDRSSSVVRRERARVYSPLAQSNSYTCSTTLYVNLHCSSTTCFPPRKRHAIIVRLTSLFLCHDQLLPFTKNRIFAFFDIYRTCEYFNRTKRSKMYRWFTFLTRRSFVFNFRDHRRYLNLTYIFLWRKQIDFQIHCGK